MLIAGGVLAVLPARGGEFLYVENTNSGDLTVIDIPEHVIETTIDVGKYPDSVVASEDGRRVYLSRAYGLGIPGAPDLSRSGEVVAVNTRTNSVEWNHSFSGWPHHVKLGPQEQKLYVALFDSAFMLVVDLRKKKTLRRVPLGYGGQGVPNLLLDLFHDWLMDHEHGAPLGYGGHGLEVDPRTGNLYVGSMVTDLISIVDTDRDRVIDRIHFDDGVRPFVFSQDGSRLYVQLSNLHGFKVADPKHREVLKTVKLPDLRPGVNKPTFFPHTVNHGIGITPNGRYLLANSSLSGYVAVYRHPSLEFVKRIPVGEEPNWIAFSQDSRFAYVSNRASNTVSVISLNQLNELKQIRVGDYPQRLTVTDVPGKK